MNENPAKKDIETISLEVPKNIIELLRASCPNVKEYLEYTIIAGIKADLDNETVFIENLAEKYKVTLRKE